MGVLVVIPFDAGFVSWNLTFTFNQRIMPEKLSSLNNALITPNGGELSRLQMMCISIKPIKIYSQLPIKCSWQLSSFKPINFIDDVSIYPWIIPHQPIQKLFILIINHCWFMINQYKACLRCRWLPPFLDDLAY